MKNKLLQILMLIVVAGVFCASCQSQPKPTENKVVVSEIGVIDRGAILKMSIFQKADEKIAAAAKTLETSYAAKMKGLDQKKQQELYTRFQREIAIIRNKEINPLMDRAQAAIALVAQEKKLTVIIDKNIVVTGAQDITEAVKEKIKSEGELPSPSTNIGENSKVGYFAQDVVRNLKMFVDIDKALDQEFVKLKKEADAQAEGLSAEKRQALYKTYELKMVSKKDALTRPVIAKVNKSVEETAKKENLVLVLDKQYVMYGGKNITEQVVNSFNAK